MATPKITVPIVIRSVWYSNAATRPREEFSVAFPRILDLNHIGEDFFVGWNNYWDAWRLIARHARWTAALEFREQASQRLAAIHLPPLSPNLLKPQERVASILDAIQRLGGGQVILAGHGT